ncbi:EPL1 Enhancer of polycomb-like protein 1 [Candida maltosa Xu316]
MAIAPPQNLPKSQGKSKQASAARFRQRKISTKVSLSILKETDLDSNQLEPSQINHLNPTSATQQQRDIHAVETGVDKTEEDEVHLQKVINAAQKALLGSKKDANVYIPTPDASRIWPEASRYYKQKFEEPESLIKFSSTVEDTIGVEYNLDEEDEVFYQSLCQQFPKNKISEVELEQVIDRFEYATRTLQPFLSMDPSNILSFEELSKFIIQDNKGNGNLEYISSTTLRDKLSKELQLPSSKFITILDKNQHGSSSTRALPKLLDLIGKKVYAYWCKRKIAARGRDITPRLKFEDRNDPSNQKEDDNDPQARKTRRADTIGAERIRQLQKSLNKARELILNVAEREIAKLENLQSEHTLFKLRNETKNVKRELEIKGDDYLFFPHKKRKVVKIKDEDEDREKRKERKRQEQESAASPSGSKSQLQQSQNQQQQLQQQQAQAQAQQQQLQKQQESTNQPYVKLPPAKIPDMDLVTVSLVLNEKNDTIKRAVMEKLRKRREHDKGFINLTDDPYQPYFDISSNRAQEVSHIPYSSIAATYYHQFNTSNYLGDPLKKLVEEEKPLPGVKTFLGSNGELVPSKAFPHISSLLQDKLKRSASGSPGYIERLLESVEAHDFSSYTNGFKNTETKDSQPLVTFPERIRKRIGRSRRTFLDYQYHHHHHHRNAASTFFEKESVPASQPNGEIRDIYCNEDAMKRLESKWRFDNEYDTPEPFSLDPSRLNGISPSTQSIRFGSMLLNRTRK